MLSRIARAADVAERDLIAVYGFGSRVYGTAGHQSDHDYYVIAEGVRDSTEVRSGDLNFHLHTPSHFQDLLDRHKVGALECIFAPPEHRLVDRWTFRFSLDKAALRREFSAVSSNSWVKAKKKLEVENEPYLGKKSLWHAMRIIMFGTQIAEHGRIIDFTVANPLYRSVVENQTNDWNYFKAQFQTPFNNLNTEFRKVAPK